MPNVTLPIPFATTTPYSTVVRGDVSPQLRLQKSKFDPIRGYTFFYDYDGQDQGYLFSVQLLCNSAGLATELTFEKDRAVLSVVDATSEFTIDSWEVHANEETRDLFSHPNLVTAVGNDVGYGSPSTDVLTALRQAAGDGDTVSQLSVIPAINALGSSIDVVLEFFNLYQQGTTGYRRQQYTVKHKTNVSNRWNVNIADVGIDTIYDMSQFFSEVTDSTLWIFPMPGRLQYKLANIPTPSLPGTGAVGTGTDPSMYLWGWLKSSSTEISEALNRVNIETDYTLEAWSLALYKPYGSIPPVF